MGIKPDSWNNPKLVIYSKKGAGALTQVWSMGAGGSYATAISFDSGSAGESLVLGGGYNCSGAATVDADTYSPYIRLVGKGWKTNATAASQQMVVGIVNAPEQGAASPIGAYRVFYGTNTATPVITNELYRAEWGDRLGFVFNKFGLANYNIDVLADNCPIRFGAASDASIYYDGTDLIIDPKVVGSGEVNLNGGNLTTTGSITGGNLSGTNTGDRNKRAVTFTFDGNYASPEAATIASCVMGYSGTFTGWKIIDVNGTSSNIVLTIKKNGDAISGTEKPTLSGASSNSDTDLTTWTTAFSQGDIITAYVDSASTGVLYTCSVYAEASD